MNAPRKVPGWVVAGAVALVALAGISWTTRVSPAVGPPDLHQREAVEQRLSQVDGIRPVLPVTLPLGYDYARDYDYDALDEAAVRIGETTEPSGAWSIFFFPKDGASKDGASRRHLLHPATHQQGSSLS